MRSRSSRSSLVFLAVILAIAAVYLVGRIWIQREDSASAEAGLVPGGPAPTSPER